MSTMGSVMANLLLIAASGGSARNFVELPAHPVNTPTITDETMTAMHRMYGPSARLLVRSANRGNRRHRFAMTP
jgi:hypothetical protein